MATAAKIRAYANEAFIEPARKARRTEATISASDIHKDLKLEARYPLVCSALDARKFQDDCRVILSKRSGPKQGSTVVWTFLIKT